MPKFTIDMSRDIDERLAEIAKEKEITKGDVMRRAFALFSIAEEEQKKEGHYVGIVKKEGEKEEVVAKVVGF